MHYTNETSGLIIVAVVSHAAKTVECSRLLLFHVLNQTLADSTQSPHQPLTPPLCIQKLLIYRPESPRCTATPHTVSACLPSSEDRERTSSAMEFQNHPTSKILFKGLFSIYRPPRTSQRRVPSGFMLEKMIIGPKMRWPHAGSDA
ncbi:hypothetical protein EX30DRAFT_220233 [Ascodesmis nigricans]|uniref:Uncharacterized protein n=1 Tax=Ascodesmis nigricans TaxID=341454 RepID=A0A4S2N013_9PEZI|nr:hypothetical protein EX30DRAFT_220233 [Ascodesmis nigricans]